jgi:hypothetical protein
MLKDKLKKIQFYKVPKKRGSSQRVKFMDQSLDRITPYKIN